MSDTSVSSSEPGTKKPETKKKVVIVRIGSWAATDSRLKNLARELVANNFDVTVVYLSEKRHDHVTTANGITWAAIHVNRVIARGVNSQRNRSPFNFRSPLWRPGSEYQMKNRLDRVELSAIKRDLSKTSNKSEQLRLRAKKKRIELAMKYRKRANRRQRHKEREKRDRFNSQVEGISWRDTEPQLLDFEIVLSKYIAKLNPDVIYAMDSTALGVAVEAARRASVRGQNVALAGEILENWEGLPVGEGGQTPRRMAAMVDYEREYIHDFEAIFAINDPIKKVLQERHNLTVDVEVIRNCTRLGNRKQPERSLREELDVSADTPLLVYGGGITKARGFDLAIESLVYAPEFTLGIIPVPYPHPMMDSLIELAESLGVADRVKFAPPVDTDEIVNYLSGADIGLILFDTGPQNHKEATPNKLFEYLHAGLPIVTTRILEPEAIVTKYDFGEAFDYPNAKACAEAYSRVYSRLKSGEIKPLPKEVLEEYCWEQQSKVFVEAITELARNQEP